MRKTFGIVVAGAIAGLSLQGCGGGDGPSAPTTTTTGHVQTAHYPAEMLQFAGRWYDSGNDNINTWGQQVTAKFTGSGHVGVYMTSSCPACIDDAMYFSYKIDDGEWQKVKLSAGTPQMLASDLETHHNHTVTFGRSDEASDGTFIFTDWALDSGYTALMPDSPDTAPFRYEAIGDSITAGFMSECNSEATGGCQHTGISTTNAYNTYVRHLADHWGTTDWSTVSRTGVGIVANEPSNHAMIDLYKCREWYAVTCFHEWDFSSATSHPDVITINLGTNDFALANDSPSKADYQGMYTTFVSFVRSAHPGATIFCINPLQYSIAGAPAGRPANQYTDMMNAIKDACESLGLNDTKISYIDTGSFGHSPVEPVMDNTVDSTHPTASGHELFAQFLIPLLTPIVRQNNPHVRLPAPTGFQVLV